MRESLKQSIASGHGAGFERYQKGSIVLCNACSKPIYKLDRAISLGDKMGQMASAFKPLAMKDLTDLAAREDIDAGVRAFVKGLTPAKMREHLQLLKELRTGDPALCPLCDHGFLQVLAVEKSEVMDKAYTVEMVTVPPGGKAHKVSGRQVNATGDWIN